MIKPTIPQNEARRLAALLELGLLDSDVEERYERLTRIAQGLIGVPIALISLIDADRQWFKSKQGLLASETPRDISFCGHAIQQNDIFEIPDASRDERFFDNPLVTENPNIRFYAGAPIHAPSGETIGTLCVIDTQVRQLSQSQKQLLRDLADCVEAEFAQKELKILAVDLNDQRAQLVAVLDAVPDGIAVVDASGSILIVNQAACSMFGYADEPLLQFNLKKIIPDLYGGQNEKLLSSESGYFEQLAGRTLELEGIKSDTKIFPLEITISKFASEMNQQFVVVMRDIHLRKQAEQALSSANDRFQLAVDSAGIGVWQLDIASGKLNWDEWMFRLTGVEPSHFRGCYADWSERVHPDDLPAAEAALHAAVEGKAVFDPVFRMFRPDGTLRFIKGSATIVRDVKGVPVRIVGVNYDISSLKEAELAFQRVTRLQEAILNSANFSIISTDLAGVIVTFNQGGERMLGWTAEELVGKANPACFHDPSEIDERAIALSSELQCEILSGFDVFVANTRHKRVEEREWTYIRKDGTRFPVFLSVTALRDENEEITGYLGIASDITEQKKSEITRSHFQSIINSSLDAIISKTLNGIITSWNPGAEKMFGYSAKEIIGQSVKVLIPPNRLHEESEIIAKLTHGEMISHFDTERIRKDGTKINISATISPIIDSSGAIIGASKIARDISERREVERMKNEFISTVSHELRTPLTSIRGALSLVLGKASSGLSEKARSLIETANRNSERLTLLINDILDLEKMASGNLDFDFADMDMVMLAKQAIVANEGYAMQHEVQLVAQFSVESALVYGDEHRLLQVFANLLSNAIKYSNKGDKVEVNVSCDAGLCRVSVRDYGRGIPAEFRSRVFNRFAQANSSDSRDKGGTGLGLNITEAIVGRHNGKIDFQSEEGKGSEFWFTLSLKKNILNEENDREKLASTDSNHLPLLICEDDTDAAMVLSELLASNGLDAEIVGTLSRARVMLESRQYGALILDLGLPDGDGLTLVRELRAQQITRNLPIIIISGRTALDSDDWQGEALAIVDFLQKPVNPERLNFALSRALNASTRGKVLHVEDDLDVIEIVQTLLVDVADYHAVRSLAEAKAKLQQVHYDVLLLDLGLPDGDGVELLAELPADTVVIIFSGQDSARDLSKRVAKTLIKSRSSSQELLSTVQKALLMHSKEITQ